MPDVFAVSDMGVGLDMLLDTEIWVAEFVVEMVCPREGIPNGEREDVGRCVSC